MSRLTDRISEMSRGTSTKARPQQSSVGYNKKGGHVPLTERIRQMAYGDTRAKAPSSREEQPNFKSLTYAMVKDTIGTYSSRRSRLRTRLQRPEQRVQAVMPSSMLSACRR